MRRLPGLILFAALAASCDASWPPRDVADRNRAIAEQFDRDSRVEAAASQEKADAEFRKRIADPGTITVEESDALITQLQAAEPRLRAEAAARLANAKGARGVAPITLALRVETDEPTFVVLIRSLDHLNDVRAVDALVEALNQPGMSDVAREDALRSIYRYRAAWRVEPQIREFYDSLTDPEVKARLDWIVKKTEK